MFFSIKIKLRNLYGIAAAGPEPPPALVSLPLIRTRRSCELFHKILLTYWPSITCNTIDRRGTFTIINTSIYITVYLHVIYHIYAGHILGAISRSSNVIFPRSWQHYYFVFTLWMQLIVRRISVDGYIATVTTYWLFT